jgi:HK97 family phage major capsid protein
MTNASTSVRGIQSVRAEGGDATKILASLQRTFEEFKRERDEEIKALKKGQEDVVKTEKVDRINAEISNLSKALEEVNASLQAARLGGGGKPADPDKAAHAQAFNTWFRRGVDNGLADLEVKAKLTTQSNPDGGYLVPTEIEQAIDTIAGKNSIMRSLASVMQISTDEYKRLVDVRGATSGWVGEEQSRPETASPKLVEILLNTFEIYANPASTQKALDDARIDIAQWLANSVQTEFAEQEGAAFITGNGVNKPRGILAYDTVANGSYDWGKIGFTVTGAAADFASTNPADALIDLYYSLKASYRNNATFITSDAVMPKIRKFKDGDNNYLWAPPSGPAGVATILGKPVVTDDNMPAVGANAFPVAFGDFARGYLIVDRLGIRVLRDPYTSKPNVLFYTTKRVGGGVVHFEAIKLLKCST